MICIFVAYSKNCVIGKSNDLPWYLPEDLKRFKELTSGHSVIMGKNTYNSIVNRLGHALPNRRNIVISSSLAPGSDFELARSFEEALDMSQGDKKVFIIGGERVFKDALDAGVVDRIYATEIDKVIDGDVYFPQIDKSQWKEIENTRHQNDDFKYSFVTLERK